MDKLIETVLAMDFETANGKRTSVCSVGLALFDYATGELIKKVHQLLNPQDEFCYRNIRIHSITAEDVEEAPTFAVYFTELYSMIQQASIVVAHNAPFDISVFTQCAENAELSFSPFDFCCTLALSRQVMPDLENHKLMTVAKALQLDDFEHHRADDDAVACGQVFLFLAKKLGILSTQDISDKAGIRIGRAYPYGYDNCSTFGVARVRAKRIRMEGNPHEFVASRIFDGKNLVFTGVFNAMTRNEIERTATERGGSVSNSVSKKTDYLVYGVQDLNATKGNEKSSKQIKAENLIANGVQITLLAENEYLELIDGKGHSDTVDQSILEFEEIDYPQNRTAQDTYCGSYYNQEIDEDFVGRITCRCPIDEIVHPQWSDAAFKEGYIYYCEGEKARLTDDLERAIRLFDCARHIGYASPALYWSYAKAYRKLEDYDSEVEILQEGVSRGLKPEELSERIEKTICLQRRKEYNENVALRKLAERQQREAERAGKVAQRKLEMMRAVAPSKVILQKDDDNNVIAEFSSFPEAARLTGINVKCIRDAACGKQKHAGGYCWEVIE